tara:strand:- start:190 stop:393 length:204 start_codon:yes stop_codon:yes gene_type:complete
MDYQNLDTKEYSYFKNTEQRVKELRKQLLDFYLLDSWSRKQLNEMSYLETELVKTSLPCLINHIFLS